jgi:hypothetical protein
MEVLRGCNPGLPVEIRNQNTVSPTTAFPIVGVRHMLTTDEADVIVLFERRGAQIMSGVGRRLYPNLDNEPEKTSPVAVAP